MIKELIHLKTKLLWLIGGACFMLALLEGHAQPPPAAIPNSTAPGQGISSAPPAVSPPVAEVIRLTQSGVGEDVVLAYIQNSPAAFNLSADQILYARDV